MVVFTLSERFGFVRKLADFLCNDGKSPAGFSGVGRFYGRVQCQKIGLVRNRADCRNCIVHLPYDVQQSADIRLHFLRCGERGGGQFCDGGKLIFTVADSL